MFPHEAEELLTRNQTYINAIQRASVSLYHLGFTDLELRSVSNEDLPMKAVIPQRDQVGFLDNIDRGLQFMTSARHSPHRSRRQRQKLSMNAREKIGLEEAKKILPKGAPRRHDPFQYGNAPNYARKVNRLIAMEEAEKASEAARRDMQRHQHRLAEHYDILRDDGEKCGYSPLTGKLLPVEEIARIGPKPPPVEAVYEEWKSPGVFKGDIIAKTGKYVQTLRQTIEEERAAKSLPPIPDNLLDWPHELQQQHAEYAALVAGDVLLTIEHCCDCHRHEDYTHHEEAHYLHAAEELSDALKCILDFFEVRFFVKFKPSKRVGAFEAQLAIKQTALSTVMLHSKLHTGKWPRLAGLQRNVLQLLQQSQLALVKALPEGLAATTTAPAMMGRRPKSAAKQRPSSASSPGKRKPEVSLGVPVFNHRGEPTIASKAPAPLQVPATVPLPIPAQVQASPVQEQAPASTPAPAAQQQQMAAMAVPVQAQARSTSPVPPEINKRVTGQAVLQLASVAADKHRATLLKQASNVSFKASVEEHSDEDDEYEEDDYASGSRSRATSDPVTPSTPQHGPGDYTPFATPGDDSEVMMTNRSAFHPNASLEERSETIDAIMSLPLMPLASVHELHETKSLDPMQAREARNSVLLLQEMLRKDEDHMRRRSMENSHNSAGEDEFWKHLDNDMLTPQSRRHASEEDEDEEVDEQEVEQIG